ncbi:hypothetical protein GCM10007276_06420 [Agaricicola taiwanensis]|uniref:Uncharacterized protein n=1 Tax=Agaricicola taiwanensis TaxID=591372 RepID=A0A8J2YB80_9RHOB|nr:hypothetical protein [Agaricicola taiwanensis]GGE31919.1 hypothetical protein GCM10007276_06420 [Agaricicola taiwanensis]
MRSLSPAEAKALIAQAGLEEVYAAYPEDVMVALEQAARYNEAVAKLDVEILVPGSTYLPGVDR